MNDDDLDRELKEREKLFGFRQPVRDDGENLEEFFRDLVSAYVHFPSNLKLEFKEAQRFWALVVEPDVSDYAIVAGKLGRNFNALKALVGIIGRHNGITIELLLEGPPKDDNRFIRKQLPYRADPHWTPEAIRDLVGRTLRLAGMKFVRLNLQKNQIVDESNPFNDQTFYWFTNVRSPREQNFTFYLGQLLESMGVVQGQRLMPKATPDVALDALEKTA